MNERVRRAVRRLSVFVVVMLLIEFLDEFAYSALEAARPLIRDAFALSYVQLGLITTLPVLVAIIVEPIAGLYADTGARRKLIVAGGVAFGLGLLTQSLASSFAVFLLGATLQAPASGIFVGLAQASLVDDAPTRHENRMALWTASGSLAVVTGPLTLLLLGQDWRLFFGVAGGLSLLAAGWVALLPPNAALRTPSDDDDEEDSGSVREKLRAAGAVLRRGAVWRWLVLLQFSDLMLDVLFSLLALYMVDVVGVGQREASLAVIVWTGVGLVGDLALIPLLERVRGLRYLRLSAAVTLLLYPTFLLVEPYSAKLVLLGVIGFFNAGWYAILQGQLYDALGEQSGAVLIVGNAAGIAGALLPVTLGAVAQAFGLEAAVWLLLAGPIALALGLPRAQATT